MIWLSFMLPSAFDAYRAEAYSFAVMPRTAYQNITISCLIVGHDDSFTIIPNKAFLAVFAFWWINAAESVFRILRCRLKVHLINIEIDCFLKPNSLPTVSSGTQYTAARGEPSS